MITTDSPPPSLSVVQNTVCIEDAISVDDASSDATKIDSPQYDFVSNLPPFLKEQEEFLGIQYYLKRVMEQDKP
jgi:hypothetical protein